MKIFINKLLRVILAPLLLLNFACSTTPSGRKQLSLIPEPQMEKMGQDSYSKMKDELKISKSPVVNKRASCVTHHILKAMGENPKEWEVTVFVDESPNAFALPGKKIGIHTGMLELVKNQSQLAAVIGHEVGHVLAEHGNERVSQQLVAQGGLLLASLAIGQDSTSDKLILAGLGLGAQFGVLLPFSRKHEQEADSLGIRYMAKAGFNPKEASELWKLMSQKSEGQAPPEILSTHPSSESRIEDLKGLAPQYMDDYDSVHPKPNCF